MICSLAQHVRMDRERHLGSHAEALDQLLEAIRRHRCSPLADEHVASWLLLALQTAQRPQLGAGQRVNARQPVLRPGNVQAAVNEIDLLPA
jgi:hypothetical protein